MEEWSRSEIIGLIGLALATIAAFATVLTISKPWQRRTLSCLLVCLTIYSIFILMRPVPKSRVASVEATQQVVAAQPNQGARARPLMPTHTEPRPEPSTSPPPAPVPPVSTPTPAAAPANEAPAVRTPTPAGDFERKAAAKRALWAGAGVSARPGSGAADSSAANNPGDEVEAVRRGLLGKWDKNWDTEWEFTSDGRVIRNWMPDLTYRVVDKNHIDLITVAGVVIHNDMELKGDTFTMVEYGISFTFHRVK